MAKVSKHHPKKTAARDTDEYVFAQLIPYIGNKRKLLGIIHEAIEETGVKEGTFVDLFSGSTVVARFAKQLGFRVLSNDWEPYSEQIAIGTVVLNEVPKFSKLGGCEKVFEALNSVTPVEGYVAKHLCPADDENLDHENDRLFYMRKNGMKIDAIRELLSTWQNEEKMTKEEFAYIMASFLYSVSYVSNTSGVFKGFHRGWGGSNGTAQYRICSNIVLKPSITFDNGFKNISTRMDAGKLVHDFKKILGSAPDIVYLDPPYNQHPYGANYHVLNTVTLWDKPDFPEKITKGTKAAIRTDWRTERRSAYNYQRQAAQEFQELIDNIDAKFILTSYSTEGNIPLETMMEILGSKGSIKIKKREYVRYRVSPTRTSPKPRNVEFVVITDTSKPPATEKEIADVATNLRQIDSQIPESEGALPKGQQTIDMFLDKKHDLLREDDEKSGNVSKPIAHTEPMGHSDQLSQRQTRDGGGRSIFNTEAKKHDMICQEVSLEMVLPDLQEKYPHLEIVRWKKLGKVKIHAILNTLDAKLGVHQYNEKSYIQPDGGVIVVKDVRGNWRVILVAEAKVQGTNITRIKKGLKKQATGNALERATKNIAEVRNYMMAENHFPYVLFGHGSDLTDKEITVVTEEPLDEKAELSVGTETVLNPPTIPDRITSANYGMPANMVYVKNIFVSRKDGKGIMLQPASLFMQLQPWTSEEMYDIMMEIAEISIECLVDDLPKS